MLHCVENRRTDLIFCASHRRRVVSQFPTMRLLTAIWVPFVGEKETFWPVSSVEIYRKFFTT